MNQEDRILLEKLNEVISRNPRLMSYRLSLRSDRTQKQAFLKTWLVGFLFGVMTATAGIAFFNSAAFQGNSGVKTDNFPETPSQQESNSPRQGA